MRRAQRFGLGLGLMAAGGLATLAPAPASPMEIQGKCPSINYDSKPREGASYATGTIDSLGAFTLGLLDRRCRDGQASTEISGRQITYRFLSNAGRAGLMSIYEVSLTGRLDSKGTMDPNNITALKIQEDISTGNKGGTAAGVEASVAGNGWIVSVVEPHENNMPNAFSGNTEGSIASGRASDIAKLGLGITEDALEHDWIGNQRYDGVPLPLGTIHI